MSTSPPTARTCSSRLSITAEVELLQCLRLGTTTDSVTFDGIGAQGTTPDPAVLFSPSPMDHHDAPLTVCTIISKNYLAQARVLGESLRRHHPEAEVRFFVLL